MRKILRVVFLCLNFNLAVFPRAKVMVVFTIYQFESLDLRPDGVVEKEYKLYLDNGNFLTYKCKYYDIVQCSDLYDFRNALNSTL